MIWIIICKYRSRCFTLPRERLIKVCDKCDDNKKENIYNNRNNNYNHKEWPDLVYANTTVLLLFYTASDLLKTCNI